MGYVFYNPNPDRKFVGDCVIRAISRILSMDWEETYLGVAAMGLALHDRMIAKLEEMYDTAGSP